MTSTALWAEPEALSWACAAVTTGGRIVSCRRLTGGITAVTHRISVADRKGRIHRLVLKRFTNPEWLSHSSEIVAREAEILQALARTGVPSPTLVAFDPNGESAGAPSTLTTCLPGRLELSPSNLETWVSEQVDLLVQIHGLNLDVAHGAPWPLKPDIRPPDWAADPSLWERALSVAAGPAPSFSPTFIHGDYQHFNLLWSAQRITGLVDWGSACVSCRDRDIGHCRLNLAILFGAGPAERFRELYEARSGHRVDPWWDLVEIVSFLPGWWSTIRLQVGRRRQIDEAGINRRVEELLAVVMRRIEA
jgi:aminoglycoside phosphotransferase (APT) family kinase protein